MISYIKGRVKDVFSDDSYLIVCENGVGYRIYSCSMDVLVGSKSRVELYIYSYVRESEIVLYGFQNKSGLNLFEELISVNGVGPKGAISLIKDLGVELLVSNIINKDHEGVRVKGIGVKTAKKIIIELSEKLPKLQWAKLKTSKKVSQYSDKIDEVSSALENLGFTKNQIRDMVNKVKDDEKVFGQEVSYIIKYFLKNKQVDKKKSSE